MSQFSWICMDGKLLDVFNKFLLIDTTDRIKISGDQKRFVIALSHSPFHFSRTLPLKGVILWGACLIHNGTRETFFWSIMWNIVFLAFKVK